MKKEIEQLKKLLVIIAKNKLSQEELTKAISGSFLVLIRIAQQYDINITEIQKNQDEILVKLGDDTKIHEIRTDLQNSIKTLFSELQSKVENKLSTIKNGKDGNDGRNGNDGKTPSIAQLMDLISKLIPKPVKGDRGDKGSDGKDAPEIDREELKAELLEELKKELPPIIEPKPFLYVGGGRNRTHIFDLTDQCDGNKKTFTVPSNFGVIGLWSTQDPKIYRPLIDFVEGNKIITLTDEVAAPSAGQTLFLQYIK